MSTASKTIKWAIYSPDEKGFWNNDLGWTSDPDSATIFTHEEKQKFNLPTGGWWLRADVH
jgi:hypothetical protein